MSHVVANFTTVPVLTLTVTHSDANEVLRRFVNRDGTRAASGDRPMGVSRIASAAIGDDLPVDVAGVSLVEAAGAIAADADLAPDADGRAAALPASRPIRQAVVPGAAAATDIAVAGIQVGDELLSIAATDATAVANPTIHSDGNVRSSSALAGKHLIVLWRPALMYRAGRALAAAAAAGDIIPVLLGVNR